MTPLTAIWESYTASPTTTTSPPEKFYPLLEVREDFQISMTGDMQSLTRLTTVKYSVICPVWWRSDLPERVRLEVIGDVGVAHSAMRAVLPQSGAADREATLLAIIEAAETLAGLQSPYLLAALGVLESSTPLVLYWNRHELELSLVLELFRQYPDAIDTLAD